MRAIAVPGRWVWVLSGLVTAAVLAVPGTVLLTVPRLPWHTQPPQDAVTRSMTVPQPVTGLAVQSYGGPVRVTVGHLSRIRVTETIMYDPRAGGPPAVTQSVAGGRLTLAAPACENSDCEVSFALTVPSGLAVTAVTEGGPVTVSGTAATDLDSGGGPVRATQIGGPLTVTTGGGPLILNGLVGVLHADTDGGDLVARDVTAATATVSTGGGLAMIDFATVPGTVTVSTDGGPATLTVPGGPYALTVESDGGPQSVGIATDPAARSSITVTSGGAPVQIEPPPGGDHPA